MGYDHLALFLESRVALGVTPNTYGWYKFHLARLDRWLKQESITVLSFTPLNFQSFIASQRGKYSPSTVAQMHSALRTLYRWLVDMEFLSTDPTRKLRRPKLPDLFPPAVAREYLLNMLDSIRLNTWVDWRDKTMLELMFCSGLRVGEVRALVLGDVDTAKRTIKVFGKGSKNRLVFYPEEFAHRFWQYLYVQRPECEYDAVFLSSYPNGQIRGAMAMSTIYQMLRSRVARAAMDWRSPHAYRHGFAIDMLRNGASTRLIQQLLGHSELATTEKYLRMTPELYQPMFDEVWGKSPLRG